MFQLRHEAKSDRRDVGVEPASASALKLFGQSVRGPGRSDGVAGSHLHEKDGDGEDTTAQRDVAAREPRGEPQPSNHSW